MRAIIGGVTLIAVIVLVVALGTFGVLPAGMEMAPFPQPDPRLDPDLLRYGFGGFSVSPEDNSIAYLHLVNPSEEAIVAMCGKRPGHCIGRPVREVRTIKVRHTLRDLKRWRDLLNSEAGVWSFDGLTSMSTDLLTNRVHVGVVCAANLEVMERTVRQRMIGLGIPQQAVSFELESPSRILPKPPPPITFGCVPPEVIDRGTGISTPGFGGMYRDSETHYVYMLRPDKYAAEKLAATHIGWGAVRRHGVKAIQGLYTYEQLKGWYETLYKGNERGLNVVGAMLCDLDVKQHRIIIEIQQEWNPKVVVETGERLTSLGIPLEAVTLLDSRYGAPILFQ